MSFTNYPHDFFYAWTASGLSELDKFSPILSWNNWYRDKITCNRVTKEFSLGQFVLTYKKLWLIWRAISKIDSHVELMIIYYLKNT